MQASFERFDGGGKGYHDSDDVHRILESLSYDSSGAGYVEGLLVSFGDGHGRILFPGFKDLYEHLGGDDQVRRSSLQISVYDRPYPSCCHMFESAA
jgi:hypothetical protein